MNSRFVGENIFPDNCLISRDPKSKFFFHESRKASNRLKVISLKAFHSIYQEKQYFFHLAISCTFSYSQESYACPVGSMPEACNGTRRPESVIVVYMGFYIFNSYILFKVLDYFRDSIRLINIHERHSVSDSIADSDNTFRVNFHNLFNQREYEAVIVCSCHIFQVCPCAKSVVHCCLLYTSD